MSRIFHVALTQVAEGKKNPEFGRSKEQRSPARIVSGAGSLKSPGSLKSGIGEGWGMFFFKATSKGLPRPFNTAGWRCSKYIMLNGEGKDIQLLDNLFQSSEWMFTPPSIADVQTDQKILYKRLEDLTNSRSSSNLLKQPFARYLLEKCIFQAEALDMFCATLWDREKEPSGTWTEVKF